MIKKIVFATHNKHKVEEVNQMFSDTQILSLHDIDFHDEIEETGNSFKENAALKTQAVYQKYPTDVFADDSGLVIPSLQGEPGIYSSRYAGTANSKDNIIKVLDKLQDSKDRDAYFITVICLIYQHETYFFEGKAHGQILTKIQGENGFGYDSIFQPNGYDKSFAELSSQEKNKISHRYNAIQKMKGFLEQQI